MPIITDNDAWLGPWLADRHDSVWVPGASCTIGHIGADGQPIAVVSYDFYNGANINMHVAAEPGKHWLTREFLWYIFHYPFMQLKVKRVTAPISSGNLHAQKFVENVGFHLEATLKDADPEGDMLIYCMTPDQCRWLTLKDAQNGQKQSSTTTRLRRSR